MEKGGGGPTGPDMRWTIHLVAATLCTIPSPGDVVEQGPKDAAQSGLLAGTARADITPPVGVAQMNWGSQTHVRATGIDPVGMRATALVLSDGENQFAMVDVDRISVHGLEPAIREAAHRTGIPEDHIRIGASHTHAGVMVNPEKGPPGMDLAPLEELAERYRLGLIDKIAGIVEAAQRRLQPAHVFGGRGEGTININRRVRGGSGRPPAVGRNSDGFVDRELIVFRFDDSQGNPLAILANFQCHGTVLAYENQVISPDWVGMARKTVEQAFPGAMSLFFQGAAGNQGPIEGFTGDLSVAHRLGKVLGHQIAAVALQIETVLRVPTFEGFVESTAYQAKQHWRVKGPREVELRFASEIVDVPRRAYTGAEIQGMRGRLQEARQRLESLPATASPAALHEAKARARRFADLLERWTRPVDSSPLQIEVQVLRIGDLAIVAVPGEPFAEIGRAVKTQSPFAYTMFCGYSDGEGGDYISTDEEYPHGGYEVERTPYGEGTGTKLVQAAVDLLAGLRR